MYNIESVLFGREFKYSPKLVNKCLTIIRDSNSDVRNTKFKLFIFKMMNKVIKKNINNYQNLMRNFQESPIEIDSVELISECYIVMNQCISKYRLQEKDNFYFFYNVALSRHFFKWYQRQITHQKVELQETTYFVSSELKSHIDIDMMDHLLDNLNFNDTEKRIIQSKLVKQKSADFLENNPDIPLPVYNACVKNIKQILINYQKIGEL